MPEQEERTQGGEIRAGENRFVRWLDNYWYHYKWHTIVVLFILLVLIVCFAQCSSKDTGDLLLPFAGNYTLSTEEREALVDAAEALTPKGENGRGKSVALSTYSVYTEEEIRAMYTDEDGNFSEGGYQTMRNVVRDNLNTFSTFVLAGESAVYLVSPFVYETQNLQKLAVPLADTFGSVPDGAVDDYALRLGDLEAYGYYDGLKMLPPDTLVVLTQRYYMGAISNEEVYADYVSFYRSIVTFTKP